MSTLYGRRLTIAVDSGKDHREYTLRIDQRAETVMKVRYRCRGACVYVYLGNTCRLDTLLLSSPRYVAPTARSNKSSLCLHTQVSARFSPRFDVNWA
ncbi:hypothetical protein J6590_087409 [Homalodisca vitripennis]|nr:hypothetical protein J6590_087409 [Homalodisca vitripennis]